MKKRNKILGLMVGAVALVGVSIMGTMAYLTSQQSVTNTFTVGKVEITLDEAAVNPLGQKLNNQGEVWETGDTYAERKASNAYHLLPGHEYSKDPIVHVDSKSEECWLFVKVNNGITAIEDDSNTIANQMSSDWTLIAGNVYAYNRKVTAGENITVFTTFKIASDADVSTYNNTTIKVEAYAVQADGFATAGAAWEKAPATWTID